MDPFGPDLTCSHKSDIINPESKLENRKSNQEEKIKIRKTIETLEAGKKLNRFGPSRLHNLKIDRREKHIQTTTPDV